MAHESEQEVAGADGWMMQIASFDRGALDQVLEAAREVASQRARFGRRLARESDQFLANGGQFQTTGLEGTGGGAVKHLSEGEQNMLGTAFGTMQGFGLLFRRAQCLPRVGSQHAAGRGGRDGGPPFNLARTHGSAFGGAAISGLDEGHGFEIVAAADGGFGPFFECDEELGHRDR